MELNKNKKIIVTHDGTFHSDDIFALATLSIYFEKQNETFEVFRTRDEEKIKNADIVFDVGGIYDKEKNRFDHHQVGGAGKHSNGIEYASFGLVWEKYGVDIAGGEGEAKIIEEKLVSPIDANDNGMTLSENKTNIFPYSIQDVFACMRPSWTEETLTNDEMFLKSVEIAKILLQREIVQAKGLIIAEEKVLEIYNNTKDKRIIVLDGKYPYGEKLGEFPEPIYVVRPRENNMSWGVNCIRKEKRSFNNRKDLPFSWAGLRDEELQKVTGVSDAMFCHRGLFLAVAKTKEGAIALAELALNN